MKAISPAKEPRGLRQERPGNEAERAASAPAPTLSSQALATISPTGVGAVGVQDTIENGQHVSGYTLVEHLNGTSWSVVASGSSSEIVRSPDGVSALGDGTVVAVGSASDPSHPNRVDPLIIRN